MLLQEERDLDCTKRMANVDTNPCARKGQIFFFFAKKKPPTKKFSVTDIINILEFLIDNIFVMFDGRRLEKSND
jgi:hypothetical protein